MNSNKGWGNEKLSWSDLMNGINLTRSDFTIKTSSKAKKTTFCKY